MLEDFLRSWEKTAGRMVQTLFFLKRESNESDICENEGCFVKETFDENESQKRFREEKYLKMLKRSKFKNKKPFTLSLRMLDTLVIPGPIVQE